MAVSSTSWPKGVSGNPSGRPPVVAEVRDAAREYTTDAIAVLAGIMRDEAAPHAARVSAANALLDRGHGRAVATVNANVGKGDPVAATEHYANFLGQRGTMIWTLSSVDRLLGLLSQTMGNLDQAVEHFEEALAFSRKAGYRPELAWSCHDYAEALTQRNGDGARSKAIPMLDDSLAISTELGMRPLMERVTSRKDELRV